VAECRAKGSCHSASGQAITALSSMSMARAELFPQGGDPAVHRSSTQAILPRNSAFRRRRYALPARGIGVIGVWVVESDEPMLGSWIV
jgi:hypothetical protein